MLKAPGNPTNAPAQAWGGIVGLITDQTDLQDALALLAPLGGWTPYEHLVADEDGNLIQSPFTYNGSNLFNMPHSLQITASGGTGTAFYGRSEDLSLALGITFDVTGTGINLAAHDDTELAGYDPAVSEYRLANSRIKSYPNFYGRPQIDISGRYIAIGDNLLEGNGGQLIFDDDLQSVIFAGQYSDFNVITARFGGEVEVVSTILANAAITSRTYAQATPDDRQYAFCEGTDTSSGLPALGLTDAGRNTVRILPPAVGISVDRYQSLQDNDGTIALLSDITGGISTTITTAALTPIGTSGSMTFVNGVLTSEISAT